MSQLPVLDPIVPTPSAVVASSVVSVADDARRSTVVLSLASSGLFAGWGPRLN